MTEYDQYPNQRAYQQYDQRGYQQYDQRNYPQYDPHQRLTSSQQQQQQQQRPTILERGRAVRLMRNGDPYFTGRTFVINQKKYPMLDVLLDDASQALRPNFGAVRCIYTPKHGTRVRDISDFEDHCTYVAAGGERFKKLHYLDIAEGKRIPQKGSTSPKQLPPVRRLDVEGRALKLSRSENMIIYVYRNGDPLTLPAKVLLVKSTLQNWDSILDEITKKIFLPNTAVLKLHAMNGELITSAQQFEYNGMYVAAGKERFKRIDYPDPKAFSPAYSPKMSRKSSKHQLPSLQPRLRLSGRQKRVGESSRPQQLRSFTVKSRYAKSDGTNTLTTTATSHGSLENPNQRRPVREEYDFFNNKPQQHRRGPTKETDLDRDDGGIYKNRNNHRDRAHEIEETRDTKIDLPIDYRQVETVDEENLYGNPGANKTPRRQHQQPSLPNTQRSTKSPQKPYNEDDNRYSYNNHRSNTYENEYHNRTPTKYNTDRHDYQRQPLISSSTQTHQHQQQDDDDMQQDEDSNIDPYRQPLQIIERGYDDDDYDNNV